MAFALKVLLNLKVLLFLNLNHNLILSTDGIKNLDYHKIQNMYFLKIFYPVLKQILWI